MSGCKACLFHSLDEWPWAKLLEFFVQAGEGTWHSTMYTKISSNFNNVIIDIVLMVNFIISNVCVPPAGYLIWMGSCICLLM